MSHLAASPRAALAIEMNANAGMRQHRVESRRSAFPELAEQVEDRAGPQRRRVSEGQVADGSHQLFELARGAGDFRLVKRIVRPRRQLVHQYAAVAQQKHLDGQNTLEAERLRDAARNRLRLLEHRGRQWCRQHRPRENLPLMMVECSWI